MRLVLEVAPKALGELEAAADWYEQRSPGAGRRFAAAIEITIHRIEQAPEQFSRWIEDLRYRRALLRRFPFVVVFAMQAEVIRVVAIAHARRAPGYWRRQS